ncbi:MAG: serine hydrolase [Oligoflexales bacterium]|nr:serine hydrolase [Oligoflexales bacterium]
MLEGSPKAAKYSQILFAELIKPFLDKGYITHIYASSGNIESDAPDFKYEFYPDNRRIFDLASLTKALVTAPLVFSEQDLLSQPLSKLLNSEKLARGAKLLEKKSVLDLLEHKSGLPAWRNFWIESLPTKCAKNRQQRAQLVEKIFARVDLKEQKETCYSDLGFILLAYILEARQQKEFDVIFDQFLSAEIDFVADQNHLGFFGKTGPRESDQFINSGFCALRQKDLYGEVHDENCAALGGVSGHAGLFGDGVSLEKYIKKFALSKFGKNFFSTIKNSITNDQNQKYVYGWMNAKGSSAHAFAKNSSSLVGHFGFTGTAFFIDLDTMNYAILLTNRLFKHEPSKTRTSNIMTDLRSLVFNFYSQ